MRASTAKTFFSNRFRAVADSERAAEQKAYLKSELNFAGVTMPTVRASCKEFVRAHPTVSREDLAMIAQAFFATRSFDLRLAAVGVLELTRNRLTPHDYEWVVSLVRAASNWALVDWLAVKVIGDVTRRDPARKSRIRAWATDEHLWVRRTALLAGLDELRTAGDFALFEEIATPMLSDKAFWIRKAIGWVLREVSKKRPALVFGCLKRHRAEMSGLTLREATKYL